VFAVKAVAVATPLALVVALVVAVPFANVPLAPVDGAVNVTVAPLTRLPLASFTVACSKVPNAVVMAALCDAPPVAVTTAAGPGLFVRLNVAVVAAPDEAVTLYGPPAMVFAVNAVAVATPLAFVVAFVVFVPFANVPLAPLAGAVNVTVAFGTRLPPESLTVACNNVAKAVVTAALCEAPAVAVIVAGGPVRFVRLNVPDDAVPDVAVTE
jgi:hypothetical protein